MSRRGIILEIEGQSVAYGTHSSAPTTWATTVRSSIVAVPQGSIIAVDFDTFRASTGGTVVEVNDMASELLHLSTDVTSLLTTAMTKTSTTAVVTSTAGFPSAGVLWLGREAISYLGITSNTFSIVNRGHYGTIPTLHVVNSVSYSFNPTMFGRKCILTWYDMDDTSAETTRYTGYIDGVDFGPSGFSLQVLSAKQVFEDAVALHTPRGVARLTGSPYVPSWTKGMYLTFDSDSDGENFTELILSPNWPYRHVRIDDELIKYNIDAITVDVFNSTVLSVIDSFNFIIDRGDGFERGRPIEFLDALENVVGTGQIISQTGVTYIGQTITHNAGYSPTVGEPVRVPRIVKMEGADRGEKVPHALDSEAIEYRVLEGNQTDIFLWLALSIDGDKSNTDYDILPSGWGAGIDSTLLDIAAFESLLRPRSGFRRYVFSGDVNLLEFLNKIAIQTNSRVYWGIDGVLTVTPVTDWYPLDTAPKQIDASKIVEGTVPQISIDMSQIRNIWEWNTDYDIDDNSLSTMRVTNEESRRLYKDRAMPVMEARGATIVNSLGITFPIAEASLTRRAFPLTTVVVQIAFDDTATYVPGETVTLTLPGFPNMRGGEGISTEAFEVIGYAPQEADATATLTLVRRDQPTGLGHIAPCGLVAEVVAGDVFRLESRATTLYSPVSPSYTPPGGQGNSGGEDSHWFLAGDTLLFTDVSTLGSATPTTAVRTIDAIDYVTDLVQMSTVLPGWLAVGDLVRLADWSTVGGSGPAADRQEFFVALADDITQDIQGDPPFRWGI